jgi:hypothetical protein
LQLTVFVIKDISELRRHKANEKEIN